MPGWKGGPCPFREGVSAWSTGSVAALTSGVVFRTVKETWKASIRHHFYAELNGIHFAARKKKIHIKNSPLKCWLWGTTFELSYIRIL